MNRARLVYCCRILTVVSALCASSLQAQSDRSKSPAAVDYPQKPIRWLVGFAPGGGQTILARLIGQKLTERWGVAVIVDNRAGAGGTIAMDIAAGAAPDGYTVLNLSSSMVINAALITKVSFNLLEAYSPITRLTSQPYILVAHPSLPVKSVKDLIALAKAKPGRLNYGSSGTGSLGHFSMELFDAMAHVKMSHIPYKGSGQALIDLLGGQIDMALASIISAAPHIKGGRLRALAVTTSRRSSSLPDVPTIAESGMPGYEVDGWYGVVAPRNTPSDIVGKFNREIAGILGMPDVMAALSADGADPAPGSPAGFQATIVDELKKWNNLVRTSGLRLN